MEFDIDPYIAILINSPRAAYLAALVTLRREGCTCEPDIVVIADEAGWTMNSSHDDDCVLLLASNAENN